MAAKNQSFPLLLSLIITLLPSSSQSTATGNWVLLHKSIGISAMHMQVLRNNKVIMFDRTDFGNSNISLPDGKCRFDERLSPVDCSAHSVLYDVASDSIRPLLLQTNTWCSSGSLDADGVLIQTGGHGEGEKVIRAFRPCEDEHDSCDWIELYDTSLMNRRWYSSNQILPDGRIVIVGGRRVFTYEFFPKWSPESEFDNRTLDFLIRTRDPDEENNLYPFLHLLPDGNLFIFANNRSILFDYSRNRVVKEFPIIPGGERRNYPSTGSSVLLPLRWSGSDPPAAEVMICGGAPAGAYAKASNWSVFVEASRTCGRIKVSDPDPQWVMEQMPGPRLMSDMILLPTGDLILINGASKGSAGWNNARDPVYSPFLYQPSEPDSSHRFVILPPSTTARMYHSTAALLPDGRILVGGSNPHPTYNFSGGPYPTRLSLEAFYPGYLDADYAHLRPTITAVETSLNGTVSYGEKFSVSFAVQYLDPYAEISVKVVAPSFSTHSFGMNQRVVGLGLVGLDRVSDSGLKMSVVGPINANVAPPGYYMLFVVHHGVPSVACWVKIK
ncbi:Aldehyde oxidase GLOX [Linum perenne]